MELVIGTPTCPLGTRVNWKGVTCGEELSNPSSSVKQATHDHLQRQSSLHASSTCGLTSTDASPYSRIEEILDATQVWFCKGPAWKTGAIDLPVRDLTTGLWVPGLLVDGSSRVAVLRNDCPPLARRVLNTCNNIDHLL